MIRTYVSRILKEGERNTRIQIGQVGLTFTSGGKSSPEKKSCGFFSSLDPSAGYQVLSNPRTTFHTQTLALKMRAEC